MAKRAWSPLKATGDIPPPISFHSLEFVGTNVFLFGGFDGANYSNNLYVLNTGIFKSFNVMLFNQIISNMELDKSCS